MASIKDLARGVLRMPLKSLLLGSGFILIRVALPWLLRKLSRRLSSVSNGIPGPVLPRLTGWWTRLHLYRGTYLTKLFQLHDRNGLLVQIGPSEYSVSDISAIPFWWKLEKSHKPDTFPMRSMRPEVAQAVLTALSTSSICQYEPAIDESNEVMLQTLLEKAEAGEPAQLTDLIQRYVFDVLFTICTGDAPGFLDNTADVTKVTTAMEKWQTYAFPDSVLRIFRYAAQYLHRFDVRSSFERALWSRLSSSDYDSGSAIAELVEHHGMSREDAIESCTAIIMAGADPLITHIQLTLANIYSERDEAVECEIEDAAPDSKGDNPELEETEKDPAAARSNQTPLVTHIREEMDSMGARLSDPPSIKELVHGRVRMPLLHATMRESLRLQQPYTNSVRLVPPKGGIVVVDVLIPEDAIIILEPSITNVHKILFAPESEKFDPWRWLKSPKASAMSDHMIAFGAGASFCPAYNLHTAILTKLLTAIIPNFDIKMASTIVKPTLTKLITTNLPSFKTCSPVSAVTAYFSAREHLFKPPHLRTPKTAIPVTAFEIAPKVSTPVTAIKVAPKDVDIKAASAESVVEKAISATGVGAPATGEATVTKPDNTPAPGASTALGVDKTTKYTSISFKQVEDLKWWLGDKDAASVLDHFNPDSKLTPRKVYTLAPMLDTHDRFKAHKAIENIYGTRLIHETGRKDQRMHLWVPGSKLAPWLQKVYMRRAANPVPHADSKKTEESATLEVKKASSGNNFGNSSGNKKAGGYKYQPAVLAPRPQQDLTDNSKKAKIWQGFALSAPTKYANDADAAAAAPRVPQPEPDHKIKESFKVRGKPKVDFVEEEAAPAPERKAMLPPHLRKKVEAADVD